MPPFPHARLVLRRRSHGGRKTLVAPFGTSIELPRSGGVDQDAVPQARAETAHVAIGVRRDGDAVRLRVCDDGRTEPGPAPEPGFGLLGMTERAQLLGGSVSAGPAPEGGWVVEAVLPVEAPA